MQIIPISPVPSQSLTVLLAGQRCQIDLYQKLYGLFLNLYVNDTRLIAGALCLDRNRLVRSAYIGFVGDLILFDTDGTADPTSDGLGSRFRLAYLEASELISVDDPLLTLRAIKQEIDKLIIQQSAGMAIDSARLDALSIQVQQAIAEAAAARAEADAAYTIASTAAPLSSVVRTDVAQTLDAATRVRIRASLKEVASTASYHTGGTVTLTSDDVGRALYFDGATTVVLPADNTCSQGASFEFFANTALTLQTPGSSTYGIFLPAQGQQTTVVLPPGGYRVRHTLTAWRLQDYHAPFRSALNADVDQNFNATQRTRMKRSLGASGAGFRYVPDSTALTAADNGKVIGVAGFGCTVTLPPIPTMGLGDCFDIEGGTTANIARDGSDVLIYNGSAVASFPVFLGQSIRVFHDGAQWHAIGVHAPMKLFEDAWTAYTPTVSFGSGVANNIVTAGEYKKIGKTVHFKSLCYIADKGSAGSNISIGLPFTSLKENSVSGVERGVSGWQISGYIPAGANYMDLRKYDGSLSTLIANGFVFIMSGTYEIN